MNKVFYVSSVFSVFLFCFFSCEKDPTSSKDIGPVTDIDGNIYQTVKIGKKWWMATNLRVTHYRNSDPIPKVTDITEWQSLSTGAYCNYRNYDSYSETYGSLYNWYAVNDSRNIAPEGWHIPTDNEWKDMIDYCGGDDIAGGQLKFTDGWYTNGTDDYGFSGLPGGCRDKQGSFGDEGFSGSAYFWSSSANTRFDASCYCLYYSSAYIYRYIKDNRYGISIRCVRD